MFPFFFSFSSGFRRERTKRKRRRSQGLRKTMVFLSVSSRIFSHCFSLDCDGVSVYAPKGERRIWSGITSPLVVFVLSLGGIGQESEPVTLRKRCVAPRHWTESPPGLRERQFWLALCPSAFPLYPVANRWHNENTFRFTPVNATSVLSFRNLGSSFCFALPVWCENSTETKQDTRHSILCISYITLLILHLTQSCADIKTIMIARGKVTITKKDNKKQRDNKDTSLCADKAQT